MEFFIRIFLIFNASFVQKPLIIKAIAVICLTPNNKIRDILGKVSVDGLLYKLYFIGLSAFNVSGDKKTTSFYDGHYLDDFAAVLLLI